MNCDNLVEALLRSSGNYLSRWSKEIHSGDVTYKSHGHMHDLFVVMQEVLNESSLEKRQ